MALKYPDEIKHNNPDYAIVDAEFVRGGGRVVDDLTALYALSTKADQLKVRVTRVWVTSEAKYYVLVDNTKINQSAGWIIENTEGTPTPGVSVTNATINGLGHLIITLSDNTTIDAGVAVGPQGTAGTQGAAGATGNGIASSSYNASTGVLTITYTSGGTYSTGDLRGAAGATGAAGSKWYNGAGAPTTQGVNGDFYLNTTTYDVSLKTAGTWNVVVNIKGATGNTGATGSTGATGKGISSITKTNTVGQIDTYTITYTDSTTTTFDVVNGANYTHLTSDGNLHVPATGTTNARKVLTAGAIPGEMTWETPENILLTSSKGLIIGDSTIAAYGGQLGIDSFLIENSDILIGNTCYNQAYPGHSILQQRDVFLSDSQKSNYDYIIIQVGLNDVNVVSESSETVITRYQTLVNTINNYKKPTAKIIASCIIQAKQRYIDTMGSVNGLASYQKLLDLNSAIMGTGTVTTITGVQYRNNSHISIIDNGNGDIKDIYDTGDNIHINNAARSIIGKIWRDILCSLDLLPGAVTTNKVIELKKADKLITAVTKTASFTLIDSDSDKIIFCDHSTADIIITIPAGLEIGRQFYFFKSNNANVTFQAGSSNTIKSSENKLKLYTNYSIAQLVIDSPNSCILFGELKI